MQVWLVAFAFIQPQPHQPPPEALRNTSSLSSPVPQYRPEAALFTSLFPFHLVLSDKLRILQVGSVISLIFQHRESGLTWMD